METTEAYISCLFMEQHNFVKGIALRYAPYPGFAEDIVQQVFLEFVAKKDQWKIGEDPRPLLATMTRNVARRFWQEKTRTMPAVLRNIAERIRRLSETQTGETAYDEELFALQICLDQLPQRGRSLLEKRYFHKSSSDRIAGEMNLKVNTLNRTLCRLRDKLRLCIERRLKGGSQRVAE